VSEAPPGVKAGTVWCGGLTPAHTPPAWAKNPLNFWGNLKTHKNEYKQKTHHQTPKPPKKKKCIL
ncbi:hypothetical protein ACVGWG_24890, partial [Enterobacter asburiae]